MERSLRTGDLFNWLLLYGGYGNYVADVYNYQLGIRDRLWEFGHLFWRPLGWILLRICEVLVGSVTGPDLSILLTRIFVALNWFAGLACVLLFRAVLRQYSIRPLVVTCTTTALLFSNAFLNYIHSGTSYIPGLAFLLAAFYLLALPFETRCSIPQLFCAPCDAGDCRLPMVSVCLRYPRSSCYPPVPPPWESIALGVHVSRNFIHSYLRACLLWFGARLQ